MFEAFVPSAAMRTAALDAGTSESGACNWRAREPSAAGAHPIVRQRDALPRTLLAKRYSDVARGTRLIAFRS